MRLPRARVAIVHDWLTNMGGAERVVLALRQAFPEAPVYTSVYDAPRVPLFDQVPVRTTWLQRAPHSLRRLHKLFPTWRVRAFRGLDLGQYDVIVSSASAEAKQIRKTRANQRHVCFCHTPIRYYWSHYQDYLDNPGFGRLDPMVRRVMPALVPRMRRLDFAAAQEVDLFIANSTMVQARIKRYYGRDAIIIHPPVETERFAAAAQPVDERHGYVIVGRQVPYKRIDLAVRACSKLGAPLRVFGSGPEHARLKRLAGNGIEFITDADDRAIAAAIGSARAFLFPAEEDFGIVQVEALAAGTPVIAFGRGGALDVIEDGKNGVVFQEQTVQSLMQAIERFESLSFEPSAVQASAERFSEARFVDQIRRAVLEEASSKLPAKRAQANGSAAA